MESIITIIKNSFMKEVRSRSLLVFSFFTLILIILITLLLLLFQDFISENESLKALVGGKSLYVVYSLVDMWGVFLAIVFGVSAVQSDRENQSISMILSHPISRVHYLAGRIFGAWLMVVLYSITSLFLAALVFTLSTGESAFSFNIVLALIPSLARSFSMIVLSVICSLYFSKMIALIGMLFFTFVQSLANYHFTEHSFEGLSGVWGAFEVFALILHWAFPRIGSIGKIASDVLAGNEFIFSSFAIEVTHFGVFVFIYFFLLSRIFQRQDL